MPEMLRASSAKAGHDPRGGLENLLFFGPSRRRREGLRLPLRAMAALVSLWLTLHMAVRRTRRTASFLCQISVACA
uniref:Uncharacterized protein n=1 Tax=Siphoviridae sp. cttWj13 TaxID=2826494 RepID=A0A8S5QXZ1_9CAUD|nr:MAG TPA: hypothetical protein [Siphoviridae sp. cttWj13]